MMKFSPIIGVVPMPATCYPGYMATYSNQRREYAIVAPDLKTLDDVWLENVCEELDPARIQRVVVIGQQFVSLVQMVAVKDEAGPAGDGKD